MAGNHLAASNHRHMKKLIAIGLYPFTIAAGLGLGHHLLFNLQAPLLSILLPLSLGFVLIGVMERLQPYRPSWNESKNDVVTDSAYIGINVLLREGVNAFAKLGLIATAASMGLGAYGSGQSVSFWPVHWHPIGQVALALLVFDFFEYWYHRASHRYRFIWRFHAVHHSAKRLYFFNAARFHFVDWMVLSLIEVAILFALGADPRVIALCVVFIQIHGLFQHANIDLKLGPLNYLVSGPELHRWHHSKLIRESDTNFGNNVIVWDLLFGTWYLPKNRDVGVLGLLNPAYPESYLGQLKAAFSKRRWDKPDDYYGRQAEYEQQVIAENSMVKLKP